MVLALLLALLQADAKAAPSLAEPVAAVLARAEEARPDEVASFARELSGLGDVKHVLFEALGRGRVPRAGDDDDPRLNEVQSAVVLEAVRGLGRPALQALVADVLARPVSAERVRAALRVQGLFAAASDLRVIERLLSSARELGASGEVEPALEEALGALLARDERTVALLGGLWAGLDEGHASAVVRAIERTRTHASLRCAADLLGRRPALDASVLLAVGNLAELAASGEAELLAEEIQRYLTSRDTREAQAAVAALARLRLARTVPYLIELLVVEDKVLARAALGALRAIGGVSFPAAPNAWRSWYGTEETWWQARAPDLLAALEPGEEEPLGLAELMPVLRELSEHALHRDAISVQVADTLAHPDPAVRVYVCQVLQRLGSRAPLSALLLLLGDKAYAVRQAAHAALGAIVRADLPPDPRAWTHHLALQGIVVSE